MKRIIAFSFLSLAISFTSVNAKDLKCGKYKNRQLYMGEKGGCYYRVKGKDGKMDKVYIDKVNCKNCK